MRKIDIYAHIFPKRYFDRISAIAKDKDTIRRWLTIPVLYDLDARLRVMDAFPDYQQVLTLSNPPIEYFGGPTETPELARLANDGMAEVVAQHPDRFPAFVAALPMNNVEASLDEMDRAIGQLGARGIQIFTNVNGRPLDEPALFPIFERAAAHHDVPIWLHPTRGASFADYASEKKSRFEVWWLFGWPYETSAAMTRIVFSKMFDRLPDLRIITHHMGAMIPFFEGRIELAQFGTRTVDEDYEALIKSMAKKPLDYFKMFYADTALSGSTIGLRCGLDFFGIDHSVFGTDCPFDPEGGPMYIREIGRAIEELKLPENSLRKLYFGNALRLLKLKS